MAQLIKNPSVMQETQVQYLGGEDLLEKEMATHSSTLAWKIPWREEPGGLYSPWGRKESDTTEQLHFDKVHQGLPLWLSDIEPTCNAGTGAIPELGRSPGEGNGNSLQYSCLVNSMDRGAWWTMVHGVTKSQI